MGAYRSAAIKDVLPPLFDANAAGVVRSRTGYPFPPYLVMERGLTLAQWLKTRRDPLGILCMFKDCAVLLATLHAGGQVHRDLKPDNILSMMQSQEWKLIDFGIAAAIGTGPLLPVSHQDGHIKIVESIHKNSVVCIALHWLWTRPCCIERSRLRHVATFAM